MESQTTEEIPWGLLVPILVMVIFSATILAFSRESDLVCERAYDNAAPACTMTRSFLTMETSREHFTLQNAYLATSEDSDGDTYRVHFVNTEGGVLPLNYIWTNVAVSGMERSVAETLAFLGDPSAKRLKLRDVPYIAMTFGLLAALGALGILGRLGYVGVRVSIRRFKAWWRAEKLQTRLDEERPEDNRPDRLETMDAHPTDQEEQEWTLSDWPRPLGAPWWQRLAWQLRLRRGGVGRMRVDPERGVVEVSSGDGELQRVVLELPFTAQVSVRLMSSEWLDVNLQLTAQGGVARERLELRARLPHRLVASRVVELDTDAPYLDGDAFMKVVWPMVAHYAELHGQRLGQDIALKSE